MKYGVTVRTLERWPLVEISEAEFGALKRARESLLINLSVEEKLDGPSGKLL
jgi:hypothetical protein